MPSINSGDGSNAPVTQVTELLSQHYAAEEPVETPQEEEAEGLEASQQELDPEANPEEGESLEQEGEQAQEPGEDPEIKTFAEFAEALEVDPSALYGLTYPMPDGMEPATLSEMKDAYINAQRDGGASESEAAQTLQAERQQFEQERAQAYQQMQMQMQIPPQLQQINAQLASVQQAYSNTNWDELEKVDPGDAALQRQKLNEAAQSLSFQQNQMMGAMQQQQQQQQQAYQQQEVAYAQEQVAEIINVHPEWEGKPEAIQTAWGDVIEYGKQFGVSVEEMKQLPSGKIFNMLHRAASMSKVTGKKLSRRSAPALRAGAVRKLKGKSSSKLDSIIKRGTDSSDIRDQTAAVTALLNS